MSNTMKGTVLKVLMENMSEEMRQSLGIFSAYVRRRLWRTQNIMPKGWSRYSVKEGTLCEEMMRVVRGCIPSEWDAVVYWYCVLVPHTRQNLNYMRGEETRKMKCATMGKTQVTIGLHLSFGKRD